MLEPKLIQAVEQGLFHIYSADHALEGVELLTGLPSGMRDKACDYAPDTVLGRVQKTLLAYRVACQEVATHPKPTRKRAH
jgi:hypothetical protein